MKTHLLKRPGFWFYIFILVLAFLEGAVFLSMKSVWYFVNKTIGSPLGLNLPWAVLLFLLYCTFFIYSVVLILSFIKKQGDNPGRTRKRSIVLPVIYLILLSALDIFIYIMLGSSQNIVLRNLVSGLPVFIVFIAIIYLVILYPENKFFQNKKYRYIIAAILAIPVLLYAFGFGSVGITSGPVVQIVDDNTLSVTWTTNSNSTGFVEYGPDEKNLVRIYPSKDGIIDANTTLHKVNIPINNKSKFIYRVGSTCINNYYPNSVEYGNTVMSEFKKYEDFRQNDNITFYVLSDIHEDERIYSKFLSGSDYDFVVLDGDSVNSVDNDQVIVDKILRPLGEYTGGTRPVYFARGNHETRGGSARNLSKYLSLPGDKYYYTFSFGPVFAAVLDTGEDKDDSDAEYSGLADFKKYKEEETKWLESVCSSGAYKNAQYRIAFMHIPLNSYKDSTSYLNDYEKKWEELLTKMGVLTVFSGHTHEPGVKTDNSITTFIGGGDYSRKADYVAVRVEVTGKYMKRTYIDYNGNYTFQNTMLID